MKIKSGLAFFILLCAIFIIMFIKANKLNEKTLEINQITFTIKYGDLFLEQGLKTIAFNEYFDTEVSKRLISIDSINGKFLTDNASEIVQIDNEIENDIECAKNIIAVDDTRPFGKKVKYKLGTTIRFNDYLLVAFSKFDEHDQAYLNLADYLSCLANYWSEVNRVYGGKNIVLPLLGTGITRLMCGNSITPQKALEIIIQTFEYSNLSFTHNCKITLVLPLDLKADINLYNIGGK